MQTPKPSEQVTKAIDWAQLVLRVLSLIERWVPALLVAWVERLRDDRRQLMAKVEHNGLENEIREERDAITKEAATQTPEQTINDTIAGRIVNRCTTVRGAARTSCAERGTTPGKQ